MSELTPLFDLFGQAGWEPPPLPAPNIAHVVAYGHRLASLQSVTGVRVEAAPAGDGLALTVAVGAGVKVAAPIHLCFSLFSPLRLQDVRLALTLEPEAEATLWSHCLMATEEEARHAMQGEIRLQPGARLRYLEAHYHGPSGSIAVIPHMDVELGQGARYLADFTLTQGRVGHLAIDTAVRVGESATAELIARVYGSGTDVLRIRERVYLQGPSARGLVKTRIAARGDTQAEVLSLMEGNAAGARGHLDCMEIVRDRAIVSAIPEVRVTHPQAKITHEAAIGSVDSHQLETLMARGLAPEEAVDLIVRGMLA